MFSRAGKISFLSTKYESIGIFGRPPKVSIEYSLIANDQSSKRGLPPVFAITDLAMSEDAYKHLPIDQDGSVGIDIPELLSACDSFLSPKIYYPRLTALAVVQ